MTPARHAFLAAKSTPAAPSSIKLVSSSSPCSSFNGTPSTASSSDDSDEDDEDDDYEACGPHTPLTPLPPYSTADPFAASAAQTAAAAVVGKENLPRPSKHLQHQRVELLHQQAGVFNHGHGSRPPLSQNSWDVNAPSGHGVGHQTQSQQVPHTQSAMTDIPSYGS